MCSRSQDDLGPIDLIQSANTVRAQNKASVTVSVVIHGQALLFGQLLKDLARYAAGSVAKVILTVNIPEDLKLPGSLPFDVELVHNAAPKGFGDNHNQAFSRVSTEFFAVLNPDLRLDCDPFPVLIERLADPGVGIVAPRVLEPDGTVADSARALVSPWEVLRRRLPFGRHRTPSRSGPAPDWIAGMFLVFRSPTYARLGGFDARYYLYCEDVDICARTRLLGLRIEFVTIVTVQHFAQRASRRSIQRMRMHVVSLLRLWTSPVYRQYRRQLGAEQQSGLH